MKGWGIVVSVTRPGESRPPLSLSFESSLITVGATAESDVVLNDAAVSSEHAHVTVSRGKMILYDHSRNGTFVNGEKVEHRRVLFPDDVVAIRPFELRFTMIVGAARRKTQRFKAQGQPVLEVKQGPQDMVGKRFPIAGDGVRIGRSSQSDLCFPLASLSRFHAEIRPKSRGTWFVRDLGSANGTFVGGHRIEQVRLAPGTEVTLGKELILTFLQELDAYAAGHAPAVEGEAAGAADAPAAGTPPRPRSA